MTRMDALLERALILYRDINFSAVRAWKEEDPGRKAVGYLPIYVPRELAHAAGMLSVGIVGNGEMDRVVRLKNSKTYLDEYRRLPKSDQELVDKTSAVVQKLLDREALLKKKKEARAAKLKALEEKKRKRAADKANAKDEFDDDEGFE